ncbi:hypothetical protein C3L33_19685, partial [Rhododendron williamsianum]
MGREIMAAIDHQYILGGVIASVLGFILLYNSLLFFLYANSSRKSTATAENRGSKEVQSQGVSVTTPANGGFRSETDGSTDVIIVGAGVAGAALACTLAKDGRRVHVIERDLTEPDRIVGELLQPGGYLKLIELGLEDCVKEIDAQRVIGYALYKDGRDAKLPYPLENFPSDVAGRSFHNGRFIQRMRQKAASIPKRSLCTPKPVASTINTLAGALYKVFCASPDKARQEMRKACFDYLSLGGVFAQGPVSLLSGLNPRPLILVLHFFAVAVYGVGRLLLPFPSPKRVWLGARLISGASGIIFPIIKAEGVRQMFFPAMVPAYYRAPPTN